VDREVIRSENRAVSEPLSPTLGDLSRQVQRAIELDRLQTFEEFLDFARRENSTVLIEESGAVVYDAFADWLDERQIPHKRMSREQARRYRNQFMVIFIH
jgi:hypothetical protein